MCGIWGIISKTNRFTFKEVNRIIPNMMIAGNLRGTDGCGMFSVHKPGTTAVDKTEFIKLSRQPHNSFFLLYDKDFAAHLKEVDQTGYVAFGHNRAATKGKTSLENTHPFQTDHLTLLHNGTVAYGLKEFNIKHEVDSACLAHMIEEKGMKYVAEHVEMAYALVWHDKRDHTLHIARNKDRPLHMVETDGAYYFASEGEMLEWVLKRNDVKVTKVEEIKPNIEFIIDLETRAHKEVALPEKKSYQVTTYGKTTSAKEYDKEAEKRTQTFINNRYLELKDYIGTDIAFYLYGWKFMSQNSKRTFYEFKGRSHTGIPVVFRSKNAEYCTDMSKTTYGGTIQGIETIDKAVYLSIKTKTVHHKQSLDQKKSTPLVTTAANEPSIDELQDDVDFLEDDVLELGDGQLTTYKKFKSMAKNHCGCCHRKLHVAQAKDYALSPGGDYLLCEDCTIELICDTQTFRQKFFASQGMSYQ